MGHGKDSNSPMVPMVLTQTHGIVSVLLNLTYTRGRSVTSMRDFYAELSFNINNKLIEEYFIK